MRMTGAVLVLLLAGCGSRDQAAPAAEPASQIPDRIKAALSSAEVRTGLVPSGSVRLTDGEYAQPVQPSSAEQLIVRWIDRSAMGDLNGDGVPEAATIIGSSATEPVINIEVAVFAVEGDTVREITSAQLGDRVRVIAVRVEDGVLSVELDQYGENDPTGFPTQRAIRTFRLEGDSLAMISATPPPYRAP